MVKLLKNHRIKNIYSPERLQVCKFNDSSFISCSLLDPFCIWDLASSSEYTATELKDVIASDVKVYENSMIAYNDCNGTIFHCDYRMKNIVQKICVDGEISDRIGFDINSDGTPVVAEKFIYGCKDFYTKYRLL